MTRFVTEQHAAETLGIKLATFRHFVNEGRIRRPDPLIGLYDMKAVHLAFDRMSGIGAPSNALDAWREKKLHDQH
jgi:hypothetical protein